jgi:hypothetical protein
VNASVPRRPDGTEYPPDILFLADVFGVSPESIMRSGRTPSERSGRAPVGSSHLPDPDRFAE